MPDDAGRRQRLDLAAVRLDLGADAPGHIGLDLLTGPRSIGDALGQLEQVVLVGRVDLRHRRW